MANTVTKPVAEHKVITRPDEVKEDARYLITTPANSQYDGKTAGVQFNHGRAMFDPAMIDKTLGAGPVEIMRQFLDLPGYVVEEV